MDISDGSLLPSKWVIDRRFDGNTRCTTYLCITLDDCIASIVDKGHVQRHTHCFIIPFRQPTTGRPGGTCGRKGMQHVLNFAADRYATLRLNHRCLADSDFDGIVRNK